MGYLDGFRVTFKKWAGVNTDTGRRITLEYPEQVRPKPERFHGRHVLNRYEDGMEKCIGCELCAGVCPARCIYVRGRDNDPEDPTSPGERYGFVYEINYLRCIHCDLCVEACPTEAITETKLFEFAFTDRADAIYTKDELLVGDDGRPQQLPWENWDGGFDPAADTSGWMRATAPAGDAGFEGIIAWSGELGYGVRAPEQGQSEHPEAGTAPPSPVVEEPGHKAPVEHGPVHGHHGVPEEPAPEGPPESLGEPPLPPVAVPEEPPVGPSTDTAGSAAPDRVEAHDAGLFDADADTPPPQSVLTPPAAGTAPEPVQDEAAQEPAAPAGRVPHAAEFDDLPAAPERGRRRRRGAEPTAATAPATEPTSGPAAPSEPSAPVSAEDLVPVIDRPRDEAAPTQDEAAPTQEDAPAQDSAAQDTVPVEEDAAAGEGATEEAGPGEQPGGPEGGGPRVVADQHRPGMFDLAPEEAQPEPAKRKGLRRRRKGEG